MTIFFLSFFLFFNLVVINGVAIVCVYVCLRAHSMTRKINSKNKISIKEVKRESLRCNTHTNTLSLFQPKSHHNPYANKFYWQTAKSA